MFYHTETNTHIQEGTPFSINGTQYPSNWLNLSTPEDKIKLGLVEVITVGAREDDRYYYVSEELVGAERRFINIKKSPEQIRQVELSLMTDLTPRQMRQSLTRAGLRDKVEELVSKSDQDTKDWWEFTTKFNRSNESITGILKKLKQKEAQIDEIWNVGRTL